MNGGRGEHQRLESERAMTTVARSSFAARQCSIKPTYSTGSPPTYMIKLCDCTTMIIEDKKL